MKIIIVVILCVWLYRYIGVLLYKIRGARGERSEQSSAVSFPNIPNLISFLLWWIFGRKFLSTEWKPECRLLFLYGPDRIKRLWMSYKEIYTWPAIESGLLYRKYRRKVIYEYHLIRRTDDKKLLKEPIFAKLAQDTAKVRGFKLVGVRSCTTGRPDWGWSKTYDLIIRIPKREFNILSTSDEEYLAKKNLDAILYWQNDREIILTVGEHALESEYSWTYRYLQFLEYIAV